MREEYIAADVHSVRRPFFGRYVSWSAIVAGLVVAFVIQILLTMLGVSIGAATIQPLEERNPVEGLGAGAGVWWFVTGLISLFIGAFVAGRLAGAVRKKEGALHGFLMWSTATVVTFLVAGTVMGGVFGTGAFTAISEPGNRREVMNEFEEKKDQMGIGEQSRVDVDRDTDYAEVNRKGSDVDYNRTSPATPYHSPTTTDQVNRIDGRGTGDNEFDTASRDAQGDDYRMGSGIVERETGDTSAVGSVDRDNNQVGGNTNLLNGENDRATVGRTEDVDDDERVAVGSAEEARVREAGEKAADATAKAALIALFVLLIGAGACTWAGAIGAHDYVPPREYDSRVPVVPGEPVKG